ATYLRRSVARFPTEPVHRGHGTKHSRQAAYGGLDRPLDEASDDLARLLGIIEVGREHMSFSPHRSLETDASPEGLGTGALPIGSLVLGLSRQRDVGHTMLADPRSCPSEP